MSWVYVLENKETNRYYVGSTSDINRRINQHKKGYTRTTRVLRTTELVYTETYNTIEEARKREKQIKSYKSKKYIKSLIDKAK